MTTGMDESCDIIRFKVASHTVDIVHSSSLSIMEAYDSATNKARGRAIAVIVFSPDHKVPYTIIEHYMQPKPYTLRLYV
jgi:hypothetical protein